MLPSTHVGMIPVKLGLTSRYCYLCTVTCLSRYVRESSGDCGCT